MRMYSIYIRKAFGLVLILVFTSGCFEPALSPQEANYSSLNKNDFQRGTSNLTVASPTEGFNFDAERIIFSGKCSADEKTIGLEGSALVTSQSVDCLNLTWSINLNIKPQTEGPFSVTVFSKDQNNQIINQLVRTINRDTQFPTLTLSAAEQISQGFLLSGQCENLLPVVITSPDMLSSPVQGACQNRQFSISILVTPNEGHKIISISQTDLVGHKTATSADLNYTVSSSVISPVACDALNLPAPTVTATYNLYKNIAYDNKDSRYQVFDFYKPKNLPAGGKYPVALFFHGGGFGVNTQYNKEVSLKSEELSALIAKGIAVASIEYRPLQTNPSGNSQSDIGDQTKGVMVTLKDSTRALQYIKCHSNDLSINPNRTAMWGSSAGSSISLWVAFSNDMAKRSSDPVETWSTKVLGVGAGATQGTIDGVVWEKSMFSRPINGYQPYCFKIESMRVKTEAILNIPPAFYSRQMLESNAAVVAYRNAIDILQLIDGNDPEIMVSNGQPNTDPGGCSAPYADLDTSVLYHHPYQALTLREKARSVGLKSTYIIAGLPENDRVKKIPATDTTPADTSIMKFLIRKLVIESGASD